MNGDAARVRRAVRVTGTVQGVGFRPFVYSLAARLGLSGFVGNDAEGVFAEVEGDPAAVEEFLAAVERDAPPLARIDAIVSKIMQPNDSAGFTIAPSEPGAQRTALVSADSAMCADCLAELLDPADRRHAYPFINCTNCGPRFTIVTDVPDDSVVRAWGGWRGQSQQGAGWRGQSQQGAGWRGQSQQSAAGGWSSGAPGGTSPSPSPSVHGSPGRCSPAGRS